MNTKALSLAQQGAEAQEKGHLQEALSLYEQAVALDVQIPGLLSNIGVVFTDLGEYQKAEGVFQEAIRMDSENPAVWCNRGNLWKKQKKWEKAIEDYRQALELHPEYSIAYFNRGTVYFFMDRLEESERDLREAVRLQPRLAKAWVNLGEVLTEQGHLGLARDCFHRAIECDEENPEAHWNRALGWLMEGDYLQGWPEYEWRWALSGVPEFHPSLSHWKGEYEGDLLVYAEQGFGDTIQFSRFLPEIQKKVRQLFVEVQPSLFLMLSRQYPEIKFVLPGDSSVKVHWKMAIQSLPLFLGIQRPPSIPLQKFLPPKIQKVAFCWSGSDVDERRRCPLEQWKSLFEIPSLEWISFQPGHRSQEVFALGIQEWGSRFQNFLETSEALQKVDAVVTIDTALAHLAGTMGIPTYVLLPSVADWRWGIQGEKNDWYESVTCLRQKTRGDWGSVMERLVGLLK